MEAEPLWKNPTYDLDFAQISPAYRAFLEDYLLRYELDAARFCRPLPYRDEMFFKALLPNFEYDISIAAFKFVEADMRFFDAYRQIVDGVFGGFEKLQSVMDFASGWGRLTRVLEQKLQPKQIWVSDIYHDAVAWQGDVFGVNTLPSTTSPETLKHDQRHDIVFVGSMFSHLPSGLFEGWLQRLYAMLRPGGVLAFSVHDANILPPEQPADAKGITYLKFSESASLDADIYGMSYVTEAFVGNAISQLSSITSPSWRRYPKGLYENQDLYVVGAPGVDLAQLRVASSPMGGLDCISQLPTREYEFRGWAIERTPQQEIDRIVVYVDGVERCDAQFRPGREDVLDHFPGAANTPVEWHFRLPEATTRSGAMLRLELRSSSSLIGYCYAEVPWPTAMTYAGWTRRALRTSR